LTEGLQAVLADRSNVLRDKTALNSLMRRIGDARFVLLGEASHGTSEYYT